MLNTLTTPDNLVLTFSYDSPAADTSRLLTVSYSTSPQTSQTYVYENAGLPLALTGVVDEDGTRFATWTYDAFARGLTTQLGSGADLSTITYNDADGSRIVTNALGVVDAYTFATLQGVPKVTQINRAATSTTAVAAESVAYDANGYVSSRSDWNGNQTAFVNDSRGEPTTITEAADTPQVRTTTIAYDATFHLPLKIVEPGVTTNLVYDASGNLLTRTLTDTTTTTIPYATAGTKRTWTFTYANSLLASAKGPRTGVSQLTGFVYDSSGALIMTTDALGHATRVTQHTAGGLPQIIVDPNGVITQLAYDARLRLVSSTISTAAGPLTTRYGYDAAGNLVTTSLPDGSALTNSYDTAHRLTAVADLFSDRITYALDALGDRTQLNITNSNNVIRETRTEGFDALGRMITDTGGAGQVTRFGYDPNGNALTIADPLARVTTRAFDTRDRLFKLTDPLGGLATVTFDAHDRPLSVTAPSGAITSYVYNGFGDLIQTTSPDTGKTVYRYDLAGNLVQKIDAASTTANYSYDALDRALTATYPADVAVNVAYVYDQAGHGFGIGRLTGVTDAIGTLSRFYDERGNITSERHVHGSVTLLIAYAYDAASRIASIAYPSGITVNYGRDATGRINAVTMKPKNGSARSVASNISYQPFGPVSGLAFGNGITEAHSFDLDYRLTNLTDAGIAMAQNLTYGYNAADDVLSIADAVHAGHSQNLGYDALDRLTTAAGAYGSLKYSYDSVGNRLTETRGPNTQAYSYAAPSNRLTSISGKFGTVHLSYTAAGNISGFDLGPLPLTRQVYDDAGRLAAVRSALSEIYRYTYDAFGQRLVKTGAITGTRLFQYDQAGHLLEETDKQGDPLVDYIYLGDRPVATFEPAIGKLYFLQDDRLGTPQLATNDYQAVVWSASYEPFGATSTGLAGIVQNLRLPGQEFEVETAWNYNGLRDYMPTLGRYLEADPVGLLGGLNSYAYVGGNPVNLTDPHGEDFKKTVQSILCVLQLCAHDPHVDVDLKNPDNPVSISWESSPENALGDARDYIEKLPSCPEPQNTPEMIIGGRSLRSVFNEVSDVNVSSKTSTPPLVPEEALPASSIRLAVSYLVREASLPVSIFFSVWLWSSPAK